MLSTALVLVAIIRDDGDRSLLSASCIKDRVFVRNLVLHMQTILCNREDIMTDGLLYLNPVDQGSGLISKWQYIQVASCIV